MNPDELLELAVGRELRDELVAVDRIERILILQLRHQQREKGALVGQWIGRGSRDARRIRIG